MISFLDSDLKAIMQSGPMSERVTFDPEGEASEIPALISCPVHESPPGQGDVSQRSSIHSRQITLTLARGHLSRMPKENDLFRQGDRTYKVWRVYDDGQGMVTLSVHQVKT
jgi:hypothetical protein